jgi:hypothetical protein
VLPLDPETRRSFEATLDGLGAQGFCALGIASRVVDASHQTAAISDESDLVFSGFAVFLDPAKASAGATIQAMTAAGISVKVLTGDNELVSPHVFAEIGVPVTGVLTGDALTNLSEEALIGQLPRVNLFCRVNPRLRTTLIQLAWLWLRHQPQSALSRWFEERVKRNGGLLKKTTIVALARKLLVALWKYVTAGVVIEGAVMNAA